MGRAKKALIISVHLSRSIDLFKTNLIYSRSIKKCSRPVHSIVAPFIFFNLMYEICDNLDEL